MANIRIESGHSIDEWMTKYKADWEDGEKTDYNIEELGYIIESIEAGDTDYSTFWAIRWYRDIRLFEVEPEDIKL